MNKMLLDLYSDYLLSSFSHAYHPDHPLCGGSLVIHQTRTAQGLYPEKPLRSQNPALSRRTSECF